MCKYAKHITVLDHHETSFRDLNGLLIKNLSYIIDMDRSGAQIAWDFCHGPKERPWFIEIIADRDLWKWELLHSKEIGKALYNGGWYTWEKMQELENSKTPDEDRAKFQKEGEFLLSVEEKEVEYLVNSSVLCKFGDYRVRLTTCNPQLRSEVGSRISELSDCDFAVIWRYDFLSDQWWISLRGSKDCKIALNILCEKFGGGGHPKACGFTIHGKKSKEWFESLKSNMACGCLRDYFVPINE